MTIAHTTYPVPEPFLVMATQNPIESEGTYPLPEAQVDRFMLKILIDYPEHDEELTIVQRQLVAAARAARGALARRAAASCSAAVFDVYVDPALVSYAVAARGGDAQARGARARRARRVRRLRREPARADQPHRRRRARSRSSAAATTCTPRTCSALAKDALRHRLVLSYQALAEERERRHDPRRGARGGARAARSSLSRPSAA